MVARWGSGCMNCSFPCAECITVQPPSTYFAFGTDESLLCIVFLWRCLPQGQSSSLFWQHRGTECKAPHLPSLYFSSPKTRWTNVQIQNGKCLFGTQLSFPFSRMSIILSKKRKEHECQMWKKLHCYMHGLKIWWMYFFCQIGFFFLQGVFNKIMFAKISECRHFALFRCVDWRDKVSASNSGWKELHASKKTAPSNAHLLYS